MGDRAVEPSREQIAAHDDQRDLGPKGQRALVDAYRQLFRPPGALLDAGGGSGATVAALEATGCEVHLVDWSTSMLTAAVGRARRRCAGDLRRLPFRADAFDGVHAAYAIQNVAEWPAAVGELVRVAKRGAPVVVAWGGPASDVRLAGIERAYFSALGTASGVRAEATGLTVEAAGELFARLGKPLVRTVVVEGEQTRTARHVIARTASNPYRATPTPEGRRAAVAAATQWVHRHVGDPDAPLTFAVSRALHVYGGPDPFGAPGRTPTVCTRMAR